MRAQVIICDEIGNDEDVSAISSVANGGAALIASAHASDIRGLMLKKNIRELHDACVFGAYVGISRRCGEISFMVTYRDKVSEAMACC